jgi:sugar-specific transcriptional regulator TrmB
MNLKLLGFNKYEEAVYTTLLRIGKSSAGKIASESRVPHSRVYDVLDSLVHKGFVKVIPERTKLFVASDPAELEKQLAEKRKEFELLAYDLKKLKSQYEFHEKEPVIVSKGRVNFAKLLQDMPKAKKFAYRIKYTSDYNPMWIRSAKEELKRKTDVRTLARYDEETKENVDKWLKITPEIRSFANEGIAMSINEEAVMISLIPPKNPSAIVLINNKNCADIFRRLFIAAFDKTGNIGNFADAKQKPLNMKKGDFKP